MSTSSSRRGSSTTADSNTSKDEQQQPNLWSRDVERVLENIRVNSILLSREHKKQYLSLKDVLKYYRLPVIIISACNSVISVSAQPYMKQATISLITCALALVCGIIGSVELYFQLQLKMEVELTASKNFYILATDIYKTLSLDAENRASNGKSFLDDCYSQYVKMVESSCVVVKRLDDKLANVHVSCITDGDHSHDTVPPPLHEGVDTGPMVVVVN